MSETSWRKIYGSREANEEILNSGDKAQILLELKRCDGWDVTSGEIKSGFFEKKHASMMAFLTKNGKIGISSMYEVGCGCGPNLWMFLNHEGTSEKREVGGCDFSQALLDIARKILPGKDLNYVEAIDVAVRPQYDAVISWGVCQYFPDSEYLTLVLEKMVQKARYVVGIHDFLDADKEGEYLAYKRAVIANYEERYKDLKYLFQNRDYFKDFAKRHDLEVCFNESGLDGYYLDQFAFDCYLYKH